jgi:hypothetical protein
MWGFHFHPCYWKSSLPPLPSRTFFHLQAVAFQSHCSQTWRDWVNRIEGCINIPNKVVRSGEEGYVTVGTIILQCIVKPPKDPTWIQSSNLAYPTLLVLSFTEGWGRDSPSCENGYSALIPIADFIFVGPKVPAPPPHTHPRHRAISVVSRCNEHMTCTKVKTVRF